ncbi:hypothetical protein L1987_60637 [Smallanthus sonchifolius]|uniref:Uncharacterized protein n=1 Tax=Smallanthus sonchifolius TaxID=185202 RepID=A0ACB9D989_9ASTR|nr:hypothetical protein L1987_60637 [Smallanthus sonchifolius]
MSDSRRSRTDLVRWRPGCGGLIWFDGVPVVYEHGGEISFFTCLTNLSWAVELQETQVFEHWLERQELQQRIKFYVPNRGKPEHWLQNGI